MKTKLKHIWLFILFLTLGNSIAEETKKNIYVVPIQDTIDLGIPAFVNRAISAAEKNSAELIIFDIDTFGGRVDAATQIKDAISATDITTIAFINRRAISAGSLISLSCDQIYMTDGGTIGATSVVDMSGSKQSEKSQSYMREEMAATAEKAGKGILRSVIGLLTYQRTIRVVRPDPKHCMYNIRNWESAKALLNEKHKDHSQSNLLRDLKDTIVAQGDED